MSDPWMLPRRMDEARIRLARACVLSLPEVAEVEIVGGVLRVQSRGWLLPIVRRPMLRERARRAAEAWAGYAPVVEVV